jgi:hypothetical protein
MIQIIFNSGKQFLHINYQFKESEIYGYQYNKFLEFSKNDFLSLIKGQYSEE